MVNKALFWSFFVIFCAFCASLRLKNPFNQRNLRLIKDLRAYKALYNCKETFTDVMSALQINLFMQNKPKFRKSQINVNKVLTKDYEKMTLGQRGKKQSQTNPNKAKFKKAKMNVTAALTKDYENKPPIMAPKKQSQISKRQKLMQTSIPQRIMKKTALSASDKTNPIKPNLLNGQNHFWVFLRNCGAGLRIIFYTPRKRGRVIINHKDMGFGLICHNCLSLCTSEPIFVSFLFPASPTDPAPPKDTQKGH